MEVEIEYTLERGETEFDVTVRGNVTFDKKGSRRGPPENWTPDEPGETEILSVKREDGTAVELEPGAEDDGHGSLTEKEESLIKDRLYEEACDEAEHDSNDEEIEEIEENGDDFEIELPGMQHGTDEQKQHLRRWVEQERDHKQFLREWAREIRTQELMGGVR